MSFFFISFWIAGESHLVYLIKCILDFLEAYLLLKDCIHISFKQLLKPKTLEKLVVFCPKIIKSF